MKEKASINTGLSECESFVGTYKHDGATIDEMHHYSACVDMLHPTHQMELVYASKVALAIAIGFGLIAAFRAPKSSPSRSMRMLDWIFGLIGGTAMACVAILGLAALLIAVRFIFS